MKKIIIIFTGGTICMKPDSNNVAVPAMQGEDILELIPEIDGIANISFLDFGMYPGPHMTPEKMLELSRLIDKKLQGEDYDGVVVTHGTDSLEETAYLVELTYKGSKPVVFTGSMRNSGQPGWDGALNLKDSVLTAAAEDASNKGVLVVMNGEIHSAALVTKTSTHSLDTFKSVDFGPLGFIDNDKAYFFFKYLRREYIAADYIENSVDIIKCGCGMDGRLIKYCADSGSKGLIIEAMGRGNVPPKMVSAIEYALTKGLAVVLVSRCFKGRVQDDYGYAGAARELIQKGVILGDNLPGQKARIKLMAALGFTRDLSLIKEIFERNY